VRPAGPHLLEGGRRTCTLHDVTVDVPLSSNQRAVQMLARDILGRVVGDRLPTSLQWQEQLGVGSGTVQKALSVLESAGAVTFRARGHQGRFIIKRHVGRLWAIAGLGHVSGALPLPDSPEGSGLATGLREQFDQLGLPLQMLYMHGASNRVRVVEDGRADFAVLSMGAGEHARSASPHRRWTLLDLGPHTYYSDGSMVVLEHPGRAGSAASGLRIGIDRDSHDHARLTLAEFPAANGHEYLSLDYPHLPAAVAMGTIDAAVWHRTSLPIPLELIGVTVRSLEQPEAIQAYETLSRAILLARRDRPEIETALRELDVEWIRDTQARVLRNEILPVF
jgi:hypothetical protein